jgi:hypothetical protein
MGNRSEAKIGEANRRKAWRNIMQYMTLPHIFDSTIFSVLLFAKFLGVACRLFAQPSKASLS